MYPHVRRHNGVIYATIISTDYTFIKRLNLKHMAIILALTVELNSICLLIFKLES